MGKKKTSLLLLFRLLCISLGGCANGKDPVFHVQFDKSYGLSFEEAAAMALYFDGLLDRIEFDWPPVSEENLRLLAYETLPFFQYEGAVDLAWWPYPMITYLYRDAQQHVHTSGQSDCLGFVVNLRHANPFSPWYGKSEWVSTAIHEMVHVQQTPAICERVERELLEQTAEIVRLEVMAAMVAYGNEPMVYPLLESLRGMAAATAYSIALREGRLSDYEELRGKLSFDPFKAASYDKARRFWEGKDEELEFILKSYSEIPLNKIVNAIRYWDSAIDGLALSRVKTEYTRPTGKVRTFYVDDLAYFIQHADEIVGKLESEKDESD